MDDGEYADADFEVMTFTPGPSRGEGGRVWEEGLAAQADPVHHRERQDHHGDADPPAVRAERLLLAQRPADKIIAGNYLAVVSTRARRQLLRLRPRLRLGPGRQARGGQNA